MEGQERVEEQRECGGNETGVDGSGWEQMGTDGSGWRYERRLDEDAVARAKAHVGASDGFNCFGAHQNGSAWFCNKNLIFIAFITGCQIYNARKSALVCYDGWERTGTQVNAPLWSFSCAHPPGAVAMRTDARGNGYARLSAWGLLTGPESEL